VTVIRTATAKPSAHITTGAGHHEIAFSSDDRFAFATGKTDGMLSIIEVARLAKVKDPRTGASPSALAFSPLGRAVYVAHEGDGRITVVDAVGHAILRRPLRRSPASRPCASRPTAATASPSTRRRTPYASSTPRPTGCCTTSASPTRLIKSRSRNSSPTCALGNEHVSLINLSEVGKGTVEAPATRFPGGQKAPGLASSRSTADIIVPPAGQNAVLVANPADKMIYYYQEGTAAPMGSFTNYKREPRSLLVRDASLRETAPGVYNAETAAKGSR